MTRTYRQGPERTASGWSFRVWAPDQKRLDLILDGDRHPMKKDAEGYFGIEIDGAVSGARYGFSINGGAALPEPASRLQPEGPDALAALPDPDGYTWRHDRWTAPTMRGGVLYELHTGTFTEEGTWAAAIGRLPHLRKLGITLIELMPIASFAGEYGWGYDVALPFAPHAPYGTPADLKAFVDAAHGEGIGVLLDVVYNHMGFSSPLEAFSRHYFADEANDWGKGMNFDGPDSAGTRAFFIDNARYWIDEFRFDGLRFDAVQAIKDRTVPNILGEIIATCRAEVDRDLLFIGENERQEHWVLRSPELGGFGMDGVWSDDFHHSAVAAVTGRHEAYYHDTPGRPQELVAALKHGFLFQGQRYDWQDNDRGTPVLDLPASQFIHFLDNHDQVANAALGLRLNAKASPAMMRAATALLLLGKQMPMLFQGQEFFASTPFSYFLDQHGDLGQAVRNGRIKELGQFPSIRDPAIIERLADPTARATFEACKLDWTEAESHGGALALHRDLLALRRSLRALGRPHCSRVPTMDGNVIGPGALLLRFFGATDADDLMLLCNLGADLTVTSIPDPLAAPPEGGMWRVIWSSEDPRYGGAGQAPIDTRDRYALGAATAILLAPATPTERAGAPDWGAWQRTIV